MKTLKRKIKKTVSTKRKASPRKFRLNTAATGSVNIKQAAQAYRKQRGKDFELTGNIVLQSLKFIDQEVQHLTVTNKLTGTVETYPVIRLIHASKLLNISYQTLWRWLTETRQFPDPVLIDMSQGREYAVYHVEELRAMIRILGEHLCRFAYYRKDHTETRRQLFEEIEVVRNQHLTKGTKQHGTPHRKSARRKIRKGKKGRK